ncbi:hypothetical protein [Limnochorda pilosa]|uniref:Uncharacterized protein n=1 Tax=Limnochorda pilosa TaxID=1555112 RepID=A0A0K2SIE9_LIMPI|nr:hypothetical protein [Limnochorda pilosa]BAS26614.1 hypothetical protein LIP_0757 [Limnochorda pilosa]
MTKMGRGQSRQGPPTEKALSHVAGVLALLALASLRLVAEPELQRLRGAPSPEAVP